MSAEKIGSLTNNRCGGWRSRMQTGKYLTSLPTLFFPGRLRGGVGSGWSIRGERGNRSSGPRKWTSGQSRLSWGQGERAACRGARSRAPAALPQCDVLFCPRHTHRSNEVKTGALLGIEQEA